jgi:hypothetical protein
MNLYKYVAHANPHGAKAICHKFGYRVANVKTKDDLAECLRELVATEGEPALKEVIENHPDKEIILELLDNKRGDQFFNADGTGSMKHSNCTCKSCSCKNGDDNSKYLNADASQTRLATQTNVIIVAAALFLAVAVLVKK